MKAWAGENEQIVRIYQINHIIWISVINQWTWYSKTERFSTCPFIVANACWTERLRTNLRQFGKCQLNSIWHMESACSHNLNVVPINCVWNCKQIEQWFLCWNSGKNRKWLKDRNRRTPNRRFWRCKVNFCRRNRRMPVFNQPPSWSNSINVRYIVFGWTK